MHETADVTLYAVVAAASPTVLVAALVVLASGRGRVNGLVFTAAFVLGQSIAYLVSYLVGAASTPDDGGSRDLVNALELAAGVLLLGVAWRKRSGRSEQLSSAPPRTEALFARLADIRPVVSFGIGIPLGVGAKRLLMTILAATTVAATGYTHAENVGLSVLYVAIASSVVWLPVGLYLVFGARADGALADTRQWIVTHEKSVTTLSALVFGLILIADALAGLAQ